MDMRTPLGRVTGLGSSRQGTGHFFQQRLTAAANAVLVVFLLWLVVAHRGAGRPDLVAAFANPFIAAATILAIGSITWHMRLGMQVVIEDYVENHAAKLLLVVLSAFYCVAVAAVGIVSVLFLGLAG